MKKCLDWQIINFGNYKIKVMNKYAARFHKYQGYIFILIIFFYKIHVIFHHPNGKNILLFQLISNMAPILCDSARSPNYAFEWDITFISWLKIMGDQNHTG